MISNYNIARRLKIAKGHLSKVIHMTESNEYCIDIVHQNIAVISALKKCNEILLQNHLTNCVPDAVKSGDEKKVIEEIVSVIKKS